MSNEAAQLIFLSGVHLEVSFSRFIYIVIQPNAGWAGFGKQGGGWLGHGVKMSRLMAC
jgi:hypothetical protein